MLSLLVWEKTLFNRRHGNAPRDRGGGDESVRGRRNAKLWLERLVLDFKAKHYSR